MTRQRTTRPAVFILSLVCTLTALTASPLLADEVDSSMVPPPLWRKDMGAEVRSLFSTEGSLILVTTADSLCGLDKQSGAVIWKTARKTKTFQAIALVPGTEMVLITDKRLIPLCEDKTYNSTFEYGIRLTALDLADGRVVWDTDSLGEVASQGFYFTPEKDLCLIFVNDGKNTPWLKAIDLHTGNLLWNQERFFESSKPQFCKANDGIKTLQRNPEPILDTDSTFISFLTMNYVHKWDIRTGELIWKCKVDDKIDPTERKPSPSMALSLDRQTVYVPCGKHLWAIRTADGTSAWKEPKKFRGVVAQIQDVPDGVLLRHRQWGTGTAQGPGILLLNPESGERAWKHTFTRLNEYTTSDFVVRNSAAYLWSENRIYRIALADGSYVEITAEANVEGTETVPLLIALDSGLFLASHQTIMLLSYGGDIRYQTYYQRPGLSDFEMFVHELVSMASGGLANVLMGIPWYERLGTAAPWRTRFLGGPAYSHSYLTSKYMYMVARRTGPPQTTKLTGYPGNKHFEKIGPKQKPGIVKVALQTGETVGELVLDDDLPMYAVDPENGLLFYVLRNMDDKDRDRTIVAGYSF